MTLKGPVLTTHEGAEVGEICEAVLEAVELGLKPLEPRLDVMENEG